MIKLRLDAARPRVLAIGCHPDDIEIGCGGTLLHLSSLYPGLDVTWVVLSGNGTRSEEARAGAAALLGPDVDPWVVVRDFRDAFFPYAGQALKEFFEALAGEVTPDLVLTHQRHDLHQDHRLVAELTWNAFRDHFILEYEIPKYDGDLGAPNVFVHLSEDAARHKVETLMTTFASQRDKRWFREDVFLSLLQLRGMECNAPTGYAEAFYSRKTVL